jgi:aspartyl-tRNA(Asn)/glutamyl-tRNA(Gln) amidotransferase subunit C
MAVDLADIEKVAALARIKLDQESILEVSQSISDILSMVDTMQSVDTDGIEPMANPHDATQRLRPDSVTEHNQREAFQRIAPLVEDGLYLVPRVIE